MSAAAFEQLRALVLADRTLVPRLGPLDREELTAALLALGREHGLDVEAADVVEAILDARREWVERWV